MKPEIKTQWLEALRSGKYAQTKSALNSTSGFCCLGVLCDLYGNETGTPWEAPEGYRGCKYMYGNSGSLPYEVQEWAGIVDNAYGEIDGIILKEKNDEGKVCLANLNDSGMSFNQIADVIQYAL